MISKYIEEFDETLAKLGLLFSILLTIWLKINLFRPIFILVGVFCIISCLSYLFIKHKFSNKLTEREIFNHITQLSLANKLNIITFMIFISSLLYYYNRPNLYERPLGFFFLSSLMAGLLAVEILFIDQEHYILLKIILLGLSVVWTSIFLFPSVIGDDPWFHQIFTYNLIQTGHIPTYHVVYSNIPMFHTLIAITSILANLDYRTSAALSISSPQIILHIIFVFLLGNLIFNRTIGLLASLIIGTADWQIWFGFWAIPNTYASIFFLIIIYILFKNKHVDISNELLIIISMLAIILGHTLSSICLSISLIILYITFKSYPLIFKATKDSYNISMRTILFFNLLMLSYWIYITNAVFIQFINLIRSMFEKEVVLGYSALPPEVTKYISNIPLSEQIFNTFGFFLFWGLSLMGGLFIMAKKIRDEQRVSLVFLGFLFLCMGFFGLLLSFSLVEERWWYFGQIILAIPVSISIIFIANFFNRPSMKAISAGFLTLVLVLFMVVDTTANIDNRTFSQDLGVRFAFIGSELQALKFSEKIWDGRIATDPYAYRPLNTSMYSPLFPSRYLKVDSQNFLNLILYNSYIDKNILIIIREEILNHCFSVGSGAFRLSEDPRERISFTQKISKIYDSKLVDFYINI